MLFESTNCLTEPKLLGLISTLVPHCAVPALPGAMNNLATLGLSAILRAKACSRPPEPSRRTFNELENFIGFLLSYCRCAFPWRETARMVLRIRLWIPCLRPEYGRTRMRKGIKNRGNKNVLPCENYQLSMNGPKMASSLACSTRKPSCPKSETISSMRQCGMCRQRASCSPTGRMMSEVIPTTSVSAPIVPSARSTPPRPRRRCASRMPR